VGVTVGAAVGVRSAGDVTEVGETVGAVLFE
jgi:hypothetical protein